MAAFVVRYCSQSTIDSSGIQVDVPFDKIAKPAHLENFNIRVHLPNAQCGNRKNAVKRAAESCILYEALVTLGATRINVDIVDKDD